MSDKTKIAIMIGALFSLIFSITIIFAIPDSKEEEEENLIKGAYNKTQEPEMPIITLEDLYANVQTSEENENHFLVVKLNLVLFSENDRQNVEKFLTPIRDKLIELSRYQNYQDLRTIAGKLYYKEEIVAKINELLNNPFIRDAQFASFYVN